MTPSSALLPFITILRGRAASEDLIFSEMFELMFTYGFRWNELNPERWTWTSGRSFTVLTEKKGNPRAIYIPEKLTTAFDIYKNGLVTTSFKYQVARLVHEKYLWPVKITYTKKTLDTHIWRHYRAKVMFESGKTFAEISTFFGDKKPLSSKPYIESILTITT